MKITFIKLQQKHFPLLLRWLESPHVKEWWDQDIQYTSELINKKYISYTQEYKILDNIKKPIHAFIIKVDNKPIGYIQYYDKYDFPPEQGYDVKELPESLAAIDFYIGEKSYLGRGIGTKALRFFLKKYVFKSFNTCFVDPNTTNKTAIRTYEKAGFITTKEIKELAITWMVCDIRK